MELVSLPHFLHDFWRKIFLTLYFINWPNVIASFPLLLEISGNMCVVVIYCLVCDIDFDVNHRFLIKLAVFLDNQKVSTKM